MKNITIIIPAFNEEKTIGNIINEFNKSKNISEIIVVDNNSTDQTNKISKLNHAKVISCKEQGYGYAVKKGIQLSNNDLIFKIDADIKNPDYKWIDILLKNMIKENSMLVKGYWNNSEDSMPVTNLVAKPLIQNNYPDLKYIKMPLSGIYLFNKSILTIDYMQNNFAFDLDLMISIYNLQYKISQEFLGDVYDTLKPISNYSNMSHDLITFIENRKKYNKSILLFMAHPDDAEIWCGGLIAKYSLKYSNIHIVIATSDSIRKKESLKIKDTFPNINIEFMENEELTNFYNKQNINHLYNLIEAIKPDIFITHHKDDIHVDHKQCFDIATSAFLKMPRKALPEKLLMCNSYFQENHNTFSPSVYIDTTETMDIKLKLIENFKSQEVTFWKEMAKKIDSLNGLKSSVEFAEAYEEYTFYTINRAKSTV